MLKGLRVTLAIRLFSPSDDTVTVLDTLLHRVEGLEIRVDRLFLDKDFDGIEVMEYLEQRRQPALIACQIRGRTGGTPALCRRNKSCRTMHTFRGKNGNAFTAQLAVCRVFATAGRTGRVKRQADWLVFILILIHLHPSPRQARCGVAEPGALQSVSQRRAHGSQRLVTEVRAGNEAVRTALLNHLTEPHDVVERQSPGAVRGQERSDSTQERDRLPNFQGQYICY